MLIALHFSLFLIICSECGYCILSGKTITERNEPETTTLNHSIITENVKPAVQIDDGRQTVRVEGRDPYDAYFTRLSFPVPRCIVSLNIDCLIPLTGAEDIEIIQTQCKNNNGWKLAHYHNVGGSFVFTKPIFARRIAVLSRKVLNIVDISVQPCNFPQRSAFHSRSRSKIRCEDASKRRKRLRRSVSQMGNESIMVERDETGLIEEFTNTVTPYHIKENIVIQRDQLVIIRPGVRLDFSEGKGIFVYGALQANGTETHPISMFSSEGTWHGINFRLNERIQMDSGTVKLYTAGAWLQICYSVYTPVIGNMICTEVGRGGVSMVEQVKISFSPEQRYISSMLCSKGAMRVEDCLLITSQQCETGSVIQLKCEREDVERRATSSLIHVNISTSVGGVVVDGPPLPILDSVVSANNERGFHFRMRYSDKNHTMKWSRLSALYNKKNGISAMFDQHNQMHLTLENVTSKMNSGRGLSIRGSANLSIVSSSFEHNKFDGFAMILMPSSHLSINHSRIRHNSRFGLSVRRADSTLIRVEHSHFIAHKNSEAIRLELLNHSTFVLDHCTMANNLKGSLTAGGRTLDNSQIHILRSRWLKNKQTQIAHIENLGPQSVLFIEGNRFVDNNLTQSWSTKSSILSVNTTVGGGRKVFVANNRFARNIASKIIELAGQGNEDSNITLTDNEIIGNEVDDSVYLNTNVATLTRNNFQNKQALCELKVVLDWCATSISAELNYWGSDNEKKVLSRICTVGSNSSTNSVVAVPFLRSPPCIKGFLSACGTDKVHISTKKPFSAHSARGFGFRARDSPPLRSVLSQIIRGAFVVDEDETLMFEEGMQLEFYGGASVVVKGTLTLAGTFEHPIILRGATADQWNGVKVEPGGRLFAKHVTIEGSRVGITMNSNNIVLRDVLISRSFVGIEIGSESSESVDLAMTKIFGPENSGIHVRERNTAITIRNATVEGSKGTAVDFESPSNSIALKNITIIGSHNYSIRLDQKLGKKVDNVLIEDVLIERQMEGRCGLFMNLFGAESLNITNSSFIANKVPSACIFVDNDVDCTTFYFNRNFFNENDDLVSQLNLRMCVRAEIRNNVFIANNLNGGDGPLSVVLRPSEKITKFAVHIDENQWHRNLGQSCLNVTAIVNGPLHGTIWSNFFKDNQNRNATIMIGSTYFKINKNSFENPKSDKDIEIVYPLLDTRLDAALNYWGSDSVEYAEGRVLDARNGKDGSKIEPYFNPIMDRNERNSYFASMDCYSRGTCS